MTFASQELRAFTDAVASTSVTPSGGAVAAVVGAMGASLCEMGCLHADDDLSDRAESLAEHRSRLLVLADEDAAAVDALQDALRRDAPEAAVSTVVKRATDVPLETATESGTVVAAAPGIIEDGSRSAAPDVATGAYLADAACRASVATVRANLAAIDDGAYASDVADAAADVEADATAALDRVEDLTARDV